MKTLSLYLLVCVFLLSCSAKQVQEAQLSDEIRAMLDKKYVGWKCPQVSSDVHAYFKLKKITITSRGSNLTILMIPSA